MEVGSVTNFMPPLSGFLPSRAYIFTSWSIHYCVSTENGFPLRLRQMGVHFDLMSKVFRCDSKRTDRGTSSLSGRKGRRVTISISRRLLDSFPLVIPAKAGIHPTSGVTLDSFRKKRYFKNYPPQGLRLISAFIYHNVKINYGFCIWFASYIFTKVKSISRCDLRQYFH